MRLLLVAVALVAVWLGAVQLASSAAFGDLAVQHSLQSLLHAADPLLLRGAIGGRLARAQAAVHNDEADAAALVSRLAPDPPVLDLRGQLAEARGDRDAALDAYVSAGDLVRAQRLIDALAPAQPARALAYETQLLAHLHDDGSASEDTGQAWWRLGQLQAALGYARPTRRSALWRAALTSYERALRYGPNEETYLLAAGYQSLANGDAAASLRWYSRAAQVVPNSADAFGGLAWAYAAAGDCSRARESAARHDALLRTPEPRALSDDPNVGAPLRTCLAAR